VRDSVQTSAMLRQAGIGKSASLRIKTWLGGEDMDLLMCLIFSRIALEIGS